MLTRKVDNCFNFLRSLIPSPQVHLLAGANCLEDSGLLKKSKYRGLFDKIYVGSSSSTSLALINQGEVLKTSLKTSGVLAVETFKHNAHLDCKTKLEYRKKIKTVVVDSLGLELVRGSNSVPPEDLSELNSKQLSQVEASLDAIMLFTNV